MGAYMSKPITDKDSMDGTNDSLQFGASSMQGWRTSQEDAHNCILQLKEDIAFFAVYDGHGGKEVAEYCALKLPNFLAQNELFCNSQYAGALKDAFLKFDKTLTQPDVIAELKVLAKDTVKDDDSEEDDDTIGNLREEADMPLEDVMAKYKKVLPELAKWSTGHTPVSPFLRAKTKPQDEVCSSSSANEEVPTNSEAEPAVSSSSSGEKTQRTSLEEKYSNGEVQDTPDSSGDVSKEKAENGPSEEKKLVVNGNGVEEDASKEAEITSSAENGPISSKGKGKALIKPTPASPKKKPVTSAEDLFKKFVSSSDPEAISDSEDSEADSNFVGAEGSSSEEEAEAEPVQSSVEAAKAEEVEDEEEEEEEDDEEDDEDEEEEEDDDCDEFTMKMTEELKGSLGDSQLPCLGGDEELCEEEETDDEDDCSREFSKDFLARCLRKDTPGSDSGCTAVVALVLKDKVYVANAGDSRCVASKAGTAVELSFDHKPEDEPEMARIVKAGGKVTADGRVNGGLNLSRALGDHVYKQVTDLPAEEQMISPMPDIQELDITPDVEFLVLACDGIWNFMSSQDVIDFVRARLVKKPEKLSAICEELFDTCLAPHTMGDGTGCDNMTAVIVLFRGAELPAEVAVASKRRAPSSTEADLKRVKTDDDVAVSTTDFQATAP